MQNETPDLETEYRNARDRADCLGRRLYMENVAAVGASILSDYDPETDTSDALHEACDSDEWVIYTARAHDVLRFSDNADAYLDCYGPGDEVSVEARAFFALEADVREWLSDNAPGDAYGETIGDLIGLGDEEE